MTLKDLVLEEIARYKSEMTQTENKINRWESLTIGDMITAQRLQNLKDDLIRETSYKEFCLTVCLRLHELLIKAQDVS